MEDFVPQSCGGEPIVQAVCAACPFSVLCYGEKAVPTQEAE
jgi:hypothetical protein